MVWRDAVGKEEGQPLSQDGWPFASFSIHRVFVHPEGGRTGSSLCVLALAKIVKLTGGLASRGGTRAAQRPTRQIFDGVNTAPRNIHYWMLAIRYALNACLPNLLKHVQAHNHKSDGGES